MPPYKTDLIQAKEALNLSDKSAGNDRNGAVILHTVAHYSFGYEAPYNSIEIAEIPKGATVVPELSYVAVKFYNPYLNFALGDATDSYRYGIAGTDVVAQGSSKLPSYQPGSAFFGYGMYQTPTPYAQPTRVRAYIMEPFGYPSDGQAVFSIAYRMPV